MAVAFDAFSEEDSPSTGAPSWTHTPVGTPRGVLVFILQDTAADEISGVTYGGVAMTAVTGSPHLLNVNETGTLYGYFLGASIPTGAQTVAASGSVGGIKLGHCITLTAAANTEVVDVDATIDSGSLENPSVTLSLGGRTSFCALAWYSGQTDVGSVTPLTNWTPRDETDWGGDTTGTYTYDVIGSTDVTAGWTQAADDAGMLAVAISEVVAGGAIPVIRGHLTRLMQG